MDAIYINNDHDVEIDAWTDSRDGSPITSGTVAWSLMLASTMEEVANGSLAHVLNGLWRGEIPASVTSALARGAKYVVDVTGESSGRDYHKRSAYVARYRRGDE